MKKTTIFAIAISMFATTVVLAAPQPKASATAKKAVVASKKSARSAKKAVSKRPALKVIPSAQAAEVAPAAAPTVSSDSAGVTTGKIAETQKPAAPSKFKALIIDRFNFGMASANRSQTTESGATLTVRPGYQLTDTVSLSAGIDILHSVGNTESNAKGGKPAAQWTPLDPYLMLAGSDLGTLPGQITTKGNIRYYVPTSEGSQDRDQIGVVRAAYSVKRAFGPASLSLTLEPRYYIQRFNTFTNAKGEIKGTESYRLSNYARGDVKIVDGLVFQSTFGVDHKWRNGDANAGVRADQRDFLINDTGIEVDVTSNIALAAGIEADGENNDLRNPKVNKENTWMDDKSSTYYLEGSVSF